MTGIVWFGTAPIGTMLVSLVYAPSYQILFSLLSLERKWPLQSALGAFGWRKWMPTELSETVPAVVSVITWKRSPPWIAFAALPIVPGAETGQSSARLGATPTPLKPFWSPLSVPGVPVTVAPAACAALSGAESVMPVPGASTAAPDACADASAGVKEIPVPRSCTAAPLA